MRKRRRKRVANAHGKIHAFGSRRRDGSLKFLEHVSSTFNRLYAGTAVANNELRA